ncbi:MAG: LuxR C-terminal-related transcriptional regulator [Bacteroidales bacterium]|nr:LuxR C-terminal-related transcriptional regulator [Bacteroidales bacterium]
MSSRIHVAVCEPSDIIRKGLVSILKKLTTLNIDILEIVNLTNLIPLIIKSKPNIIIINPSYIGSLNLNTLKKETRLPNIQYIALQTTILDTQLLTQFNQVINIMDSPEEIKEKLIKLTTTTIDTNKKELSVREKDIIKLVVKGMTNKQIANELCLSIHTVITHRRNISTKLQIHSTSGLTIYAIINKLVEINEIKDIKE